MSTLLEQLQAQSEVTSALVGDVISTGAQIRIRTGHEPTIVPVDGQQTYCIFPEIGLTRLTVRNQNGMYVVSATLTTTGEEIGLLDAEGNRIPLPAYTDQSFATWRTWVHPLNVEMMKAEEKAVKELTEYLDSLGFVQWSRRPRPGQEVRERTTETLYDKEVPGTSLVDRHASAPRLRTVTIIPDERTDANMTTYRRRADNQEVTRPGFTSFPDTILANTAKVIEAFNLPSDDKERSDKQREANNRLSLLTGTDPETGYSTRPSWGYLSFIPDGKSSAETVAGGKELNLFTPNTDDSTSAVSAEGQSTMGGSSVAGDSDDPFEGMDGAEDPSDS